jgi:hypothetical protein
MRTWRYTLLALLSGCIDLGSDFTAIDAHYTDPSLRLHAAVHQRVETSGDPTTSFEVWVARSAHWTGEQPDTATLVREATVHVGGERLVEATLFEDERGARYVAELDHWISRIEVSARVGADEIAITNAEMMSNPDEMNVSFPDVVIPGAASALRWTAQGAPVTPMITVTTVAQPIRFTLITTPIRAETGQLDLPVETFPETGEYAINLVRLASYALAPGDSYDDRHVSLNATTYWHKRVLAAAAPVP